MNFTTILFGLVIATCGFVGSALAEQVPPACRGLQAQKTFATKIAEGRSIVREALEDVDQCGHDEHVVERVLDRVRQIELPSASSVDLCALCGNTAIVQGVYEEIHDAWAQLGFDCCTIGVIIAEVEGKLYCNLSIALGGLGVADYLPRSTRSLCGATLENCCDARFEAFTETYIDPGGEQCRPYTNGKWRSIWTLARNNLCLYE